MGDPYSKFYKVLIDQQRGLRGRSPGLLAADRASMALVSTPPRSPRLTIAGSNRLSPSVLPDPGPKSASVLALDVLRSPPSPSSPRSRVYSLADDLSVAVREWMLKAEESGLMQADDAGDQLVAFINGWILQAEEDGRLPQIEDAILLASMSGSPLLPDTDVNLNDLLRRSIIRYLEQKLQRQQHPSSVDGVLGAAAV